MRYHFRFITPIISFLVISLGSSCTNDIEDNYVSNKAILHFDLTLPEDGIFSKIILLTNASFGSSQANGDSTSIINEAIDIVNPIRHLVFDVSLPPVDLREKRLTGKLISTDDVCYTFELEPYNFQAGEIYTYVRDVEQAECAGLPILFLTTPNSKAVDSKSEWIMNSTATIVGGQIVTFQKNVKSRDVEMRHGRMLKNPL